MVVAQRRAMFSARINRSEEILLAQMQEISRRAIARLEKRSLCTPEAFTEALKMRENLLSSDVPVKPNANSSVPPTLALFPGTYFLSLIDEKNRRSYSRTSDHPGLPENHVNGFLNGFCEVEKVNEKCEPGMSPS
ncbi:hypothetical protein KIN20_005352 [Parelaphostrongylus tenuis]|uniref:Hydroxymethylglutaryl-coenzyme A synthase C-terminal domain-containing protein n=1 Tax=Parelaphostrongylus tenuis TaxID=148309 RepID=A0AAD5QF33_PARTN|nr:hypothetical protein KIN20_005352 [Parelaphostrongylus tenuis]